MKQNFLIPIILDEMSPPAILNNTSCIICNSNSKESYFDAKFKIDKAICKNSIKKTELDARSKTSSMIVLTVAIELFAMFLVFVVSFGKNVGYSFANEDFIS